MCEFRVEKGKFAVPSRKGGTKYPFHKMEVGDSFFVPLAGRKSAGQCIRKAASSRGFKVTIRRAEEGGKPGFRCWLIEPAREGGA